MIYLSLLHILPPFLDSSANLNLINRGVQLKLAYSWARPAILVAGKGRGGMFLFLLFLHFHSCSYFFHNRLFHLLYYISFLPFSGRRHKMTHKGWRVVKPQHNQTNLINHSISGHQASRATKPTRWGYLRSASVPGEQILITYAAVGYRTRATCVTSQHSTTSL